MTPNVVSYNAAMSACEKGKHWEGALVVLHEMVCHALTPNLVSYIAAISACKKGKQWEGVLGLLQEVVQCVLAPRKIGELELEFEIPSWNSNWDFEKFTVKFTVRLESWILKIQRLGGLEFQLGF